MKPYFFLFLCLLCCHCSIHTNAQAVLDGGLENIDHVHHWPKAWQNIMPNNNYDYKLDSVVVKQGKYAVSIASKNDNPGFGAVSCVIPGAFSGYKLQLKGFIKTENVVGFAGFWLRIDGTRSFDNMDNQNIHGTTDWKEYTIDLPYDSENAVNINVGALLVGTGKMWFDDVRLYLNGTPIENVNVKQIKIYKAKQDTAFSKSSGIASVALNEQTIKNLALLGQAWGFVKYHLPSVAAGDVNMDAELFRVMPAIIKAQNNKQASNAIEQWLDKLGSPPVCNTCSANKVDAAIKPDHGVLFDKNVVSTSLMNKLTYTLNNHNTGKSYYIDMAPSIGNPVFKNELPYAQMEYPDAGYRLLCLFRYWNMVQYFSPNRLITGQDWNKVLPAFIPRFIEAKNAADYQLTTLALIATINDTHANIWSNLKALNDYQGALAPPFQAKFIEDKLTVTGYYNDTLKVRQNFKIGDVIKSINHVSVADLIKKYLPYTPASNYETQLRDMPVHSLLRGNFPFIAYELIRDGKTISVNQESLPRTQIKYASLNAFKSDEPGFHLIDNQIGYLYPGNYHNKDLPAIKKMFNGTKGIIIDMRCYPSEFMPFTFVPYIKSGKNDFVKFTAGNVNNPGQFVFKQPIGTNPTGEYTGKVVVIVNEQSQSQAEYTTMAFQSSPNVTVIGSTTAGADGDVSTIVLPGGISTLISGLGVFYPDGTPTQRKGVRIDEIVKPTVAGIKAGKDELLDRAKAIILN